jgi:formate/nitrite transporter FocA (FNT family)
MDYSSKAYTPRETAELVSRTGVIKGNTRIDRVFLSAVNAGMILSFACASHLSIQSSPWFQENAPGLIKALGALVFPYGK